MAGDVLPQEVTCALANSSVIVYLLLGIVAGFLLGRYVKFGKAKKSDDGNMPASEAESPAGGAIMQSITAQIVNARGHSDSITLEPALLTEVHGLLQSNRKVEAIQQVRETCGLDLKSAKAIVNALVKMMQ